MANHSATKKSSKQSKVRRLRNRYSKKTTSNLIRDFEAESDLKKKQKDLPKISSHIDKLAKKNIIHANKAANLKSRLTKSVNSALASLGQQNATEQVAEKDVADNSNEESKR